VKGPARTVAKSFGLRSAIPHGIRSAKTPLLR
jgi:hypothetical protein